MILDATNKRLEIKLGEAHVTTACDWTASYGVYTATAFTPGGSDGVTNGVTAVVAVAAPVSGTQRLVQEVTVHNSDTVPHIVIVQLIDGASTRIVQRQSVAVNGDFRYTASGPGSVDLAAYAPLASPAFTGNPLAPTPSPGDNDTSVATTAFVAASYAPLASPTFTGTPAAPTVASTAAAGTTQLATTAFVRNGTTTNDNALAGQVGEFVSNTAAGVGLTTATPATITSISLTAGDWDVSGQVSFVAAATTTVQAIIACANLTAAAVAGAIAGSTHQLILTFTAAVTQAIPIGTCRLSLGATTTVYLVGQANFGVSTLTASGYLGARRVR